MSNFSFIEVPRSCTTERCLIIDVYAPGVPGVNHEVECGGQPGTNISCAGQSGSLGPPSISLLLKRD